MNYEQQPRTENNTVRRSMNTVIENALTRKPLTLVRKQAHLGDTDSRYTPVAIHASESASEDDGGFFNAAAPPLSAPTTNAADREAPLRHMSLFDLVGACCGMWKVLLLTRDPWCGWCINT
mmetsp:Transcript_24812/g.47522  ORF Transcript_24812/g.47522 Transcript_24812/m.47522 type:complete len:121 (+) Transcript_24812:133-495(+)